MNPNNRRFKILLLCTGNSARSILAEYLLRKIGPERFEVYSAGSNPKPFPHPMALKLLQEDYLLDVSDARSKSWEEFNNVPFDFVITLCDDTKENCPIYPGKPIMAHWSSPDPATFARDEKAARHIFFQVAQQIKRRLELLTSLPFDKLDELRLELATREIGHQEKITLSEKPGVSES